MGSLLYLVFVLLWLGIHGQVTFVDLAGTYTRVPNWDRMRFCIAKVGIEVSGSTITSMQFTNPSNGCSASGLTLNETSGVLRSGRFYVMAAMLICNCASFQSQSKVI